MYECMYVYIRVYMYVFIFKYLCMCVIFQFFFANNVSIKIPCKIKKHCWNLSITISCKESENVSKNRSKQILSQEVFDVIGQFWNIWVFYKMRMRIRPHNNVQKVFGTSWKFFSKWPLSFYKNFWRFSLLCSLKKKKKKLKKESGIFVPYRILPSLRL